MNIEGKKTMLLKIKFYYKIILNILFKALYVNRRYIYFHSYHGQYNDNPKYISETLQKIDPNVVCIWEINQKSNEKDLPASIKRVSPETLKSFFYKNLSKVVIDNYAGYYSGYLMKNEKIKRLILSALKNKKQLNIATWHGTPLKKIAIDDPSFGHYDQFVTTADKLLAGNEYTRDILQRITYSKVPILTIGTPRNDILLKSDVLLKKQLKNRLKLPCGKKIALFAPTFRNDIYKSGVMQMEQFDFPILLQTLSRKFGGEWVFVYRFHDSVLRRVNLDSLTIDVKTMIYNGNLGDDMAEYLYVCDLMITDYSSSMFDYALTYKPCFLYCPDLNFYETKERGFYRDIRELPYPLATTFVDLINNVTSFSEDEYVKQIKRLLQEVGNWEDGNASDRVAKIVYQFMFDC